MFEGDIQSIDVFQFSPNNLMNSKATFILSYVIGFVVILISSYKKLEELVRVPRIEGYDVLGNIAPSTLFGRRAFMTSFWVYLTLVIILYTFVCIVPQFAVNIFALSPDDAALVGPTWPLGAALLVVGLVPSTPIFESIERELRGFAQRFADIPSSLFDNIRQLSVKELENDILPDARYARTTCRFREIQNALLLLGIEQDEAHRIARNYVSADVLARITVESPDIWSYDEQEKVGALISTLRSRWEKAETDIQSLISRTENSHFVQEGMRRHSIASLSMPIAADLKSEIERENADSNFIRANNGDGDKFIIERKEIREHWRDVSLEMARTNVGMRSLFSILATNDLNVSAGGDKIFSDLLAMIRSGDGKFAFGDLLSSVIFSDIVLYFLYIVIHVILFIIISLILDQTTSSFAFDILTKTINSMWASSWNIIIAGSEFAVAAFIANYIRIRRLDDASWERFINFYDASPMQYIICFMWSLVFAFATKILFYWIYFMAYQGEAFSAGNFKYFSSLENIVGILLSSLPAAFFSIGTCVIADIAITGRGWPLTSLVNGRAEKESHTPGIVPKTPWKIVLFFAIVVTFSSAAVNLHPIANATEKNLALLGKHWQTAIHTIDPIRTATVFSLIGLWDLYRRGVLRRGRVGATVTMPTQSKDVQPTVGH